MERANIDDYIQQGIHGVKETKPDERRKYLGTIRERVVIALTASQVKEGRVYPEVEKAIRENPKAQLFLNGNLDYSYHSKYIQVASKINMEFTMVNNKEYNSELGLVLAYDYAIDKEEIYVTNSKMEGSPSSLEENSNSGEQEGKGIFSAFTKMFKK